MGGQNGPIDAGDLIARATAVDGSKVEGAVDVCVGVGQIDPSTKRDEMLLAG